MKNTHDNVANIQLPISNDHGVPVLVDFLNEIQRMYNVEKDLKNELYSFLIEHRLMDLYMKESSLKKEPRP